MGFLDRLFARYGSQAEVEATLYEYAPRDPRTDPRPWDGTRGLSVVGESHYQDALMLLSGAPARGEHRWEGDVLLVPEPENRYDPKAIAVKSESGHKLGHLSRHNARRERRRVLTAIESHGEARCQAFVGRPADGPYLGMRLRIRLDGPLG